MIRKKLKQHKTAALAAAAVICVTAVTGTLAVYGQNMAEKQVKQAAEEKMSSEETAVYAAWGEGTLYKDVVEDHDIVKQVCQKYGLDHDSVTMKDITRDMRNYEEALWLLAQMGEKPLFTVDNMGMDSLETYVGDIYAFNGAKQVIASYCREHGLDAESMKIKDLTAEDLVAICEIAYDTSDHPKN